MPTVGGIPDFWIRLAESDRLALLLDYDGTLAPFHQDRMKAKPLDGIAEALNTINCSQRTNLALISGRPVKEVQALIGNQDLVIAGTHGWELYTPASGVCSPTLSPSQRQTLDIAYQQASLLSDRGHIERKLATVAVHTRALPPAQALSLIRQIKDVWNVGLPDGEVEIREFDGGVEFRIVGRTKANAVREILSMWPGPQLIVYIGDDDTDEDAFIFLNSDFQGEGLSIRVGQVDRPSAAQGRLYSVEEVRQLLWSWLNATM